METENPFDRFNNNPLFLKSNSIVMDGYFFNMALYVSLLKRKHRINPIKGKSNKVLHDH